MLQLLLHQRSSPHLSFILLQGFPFVNNICGTRAIWIVIYFSDHEWQQYNRGVGLGPPQAPLRFAR